MAESDRVVILALVLGFLVLPVFGLTVGLFVTGLCFGCRRDYWRSQDDDQQAGARCPPPCRACARRDRVEAKFCPACGAERGRGAVRR